MNLFEMLESYRTSGTKSRFINWGSLFVYWSRTVNLGFVKVGVALMCRHVG